MSLKKYCLNWYVRVLGLDDTVLTVKMFYNITFPFVLNADFCNETCIHQNNHRQR